jgi:hypothetical protein
MPGKTKTHYSYSIEKNLTGKIPIGRPKTRRHKQQTERWGKLNV